MGSRIRFTKAIQVFEAYPDLNESVHAPSALVGPEDYVVELQKSDAPLMALDYFAHALPKREAVWWGMKCVSGLDRNQSENDKELLALTENWVREGDEEARAKVHAAAEETSADSASVWIGRAAGWSGGSLSPLPEQRVEMPEGLTAKAVNAAILIALGALMPEERDKALGDCLSAGLSFAGGGNMPSVSVAGQPSAQS
ncbi:hypothetical protein ABLO27_04230 [Roseibium sp. SCPC15]|uniref:DUF6931 family protein n=1 Tax=Roseibium sp. SCP15 TaxID=3141376 RepID=UPI0033350B46